MSISYPLAIPAVIGEAKADLQMYDAIGENISPFTGSAQEQQNADQHWALELEWPEMTWAQFAAFQAWAGALHGKWGTFLWGPPWATGPRGSAPAWTVPLCAGTDLSGSNVLTTRAWMPSSSGMLLPGDFLQVGSSIAGLLAISGAAIGPTGVGGVKIVLTFSSLPALLNQFGLVSPPLGFRPIIPSWLGAGQPVIIAGTGLIDGNFALTGVSIAPDIGTSYKLTITFQDSPASFGTGSLPAGSMISTPPARLYQYVTQSPLASDGGGNVSLDIFPALREAPGLNWPITLLQPQGTFRLADNRRKGPAEKTRTFKFMAKGREAI